MYVRMYVCTVAGIRFYLSRASCQTQVLRCTLWSTLSTSSLSEGEEVYAHLASYVSCMDGSTGDFCILFHKLADS